MRLRPATRADVDAVADLDAAVFGVDAWGRSALAEELTGAGRYAVVAEEGAALAGYAVLRVVAETAEVQRVAVTPSRRRAGFGAALLAAVVAAAGRAGCTEVLLELRADNAAARRLYHRFGFVELARRPAYYADRADAVVLRLSGPLTNACEGR